MAESKASKYNIVQEPPTEKQLQVYKQFQEHVAKLLEENESYKDLPHEETDLHRFCRARDYDLKKTILMYDNYMAWRAEIGDVTGSKTWMKDYGTYYLCPKNDKFGRPVLVCRICQYNPKQRANNEEMLDDMVGEFVELLETITAPPHMENGIERMCVIVDFKDSTSSSNDLALVKKFSQILQDYFPERLGACFLAYNSWMFGAFWKLIQVFLDKKTVAKVHFLGSKPKDVLLQVIDEDNLPVTFGGKLEIPEIKVDPWAKIAKKSKK
mmetsp:Transcript_18652/g.20741  ORF Transcript_18652/g.20741 Transcript_18652/m.20741 type:complete len:268 (+) Transcript_18652:78-881(+)